MSTLKDFQNATAKMDSARRDLDFLLNQISCKHDIDTKMVISISSETVFNDLTRRAVECETHLYNYMQAIKMWFKVVERNPPTEKELKKL
jgi:hypothetical protein